VAAVVNSLNSAVQFAMDQSSPRRFIMQSKYPRLFPASLKYHICKKNYFLDDLKI
jgi:hypothetical protein